MKKQLSRRSFMKGLLAGSGLTLLPGLYLGWVPGTRRGRNKKDRP